MALELGGQTLGQTGLTTYFVLTNSVGFVRSSGTTFSAYSTANRNSGVIAATGRADGSYWADMPLVVAGTYYFTLWRQLGGSPAESDTVLAGPGELQWNGTAVVTQSQLVNGVTHGGVEAKLHLGTSTPSVPALLVKSTTPSAPVVLFDADDVSTGTGYGMIEFRGPSEAVGIYVSAGSLADGAFINTLDIPIIAPIQGNITGNLSGSIGSVATNGITATSIANDAITDAKIAVPAEAAGLPTGILGMIRRLFEKAINRRTRNRLTGAYTLYGADNTTAIETSTQSTATSVDQITKGAAP
jgi:hypothetical protein